MKLTTNAVGGVSAAVSKTAAAPIERVKLLIQNQVCHFQWRTACLSSERAGSAVKLPAEKNVKR